MRGRELPLAVSAGMGCSFSFPRLQSHSPSLKTLFGGVGGKGKVGTVPEPTSWDSTVRCFCLHSPQTAPGFCKNSARSLVALYHKGALPCECHPTGALGHHCSPEGGQCPCRPGIIGQRCTHCQTGYYGFPHCKRKCTFRPSEVASGPRWRMLIWGRAGGLSNFTGLETHLGIL